MSAVNLRDVLIYDSLAKTVNLPAFLLWFPSVLRILSRKFQILRSHMFFRPPGSGSFMTKQK
jgi:hypothetical protein